MTVQEVLKMLELNYKKNGKFLYNYTENTKLLANAKNSSDDYPCVALSKMMIDPMSITNVVPDRSNSNYIEVISIIIGNNEFDYYYCLYVQDITNYLEKVNNKDTRVCILYYSLYTGWAYNIVKSNKVSHRGAMHPKLKELFGNNVFHLTYC